jgi:hypothetical protein
MPNTIVCEGCGNDLVPRYPGQRTCQKSRCQRRAESLRSRPRKPADTAAVDLAEYFAIDQRSPGRPPVRRRFTLARSRARHYGKRWELELPDFVSLVRQPCAYCGIEGRSSIDQVVPGVGYVEGNVAPCCWTCNDVKGNTFTADEMRLLGPVLRSIYASWPEARFRRHKTPM